MDTNKATVAEMHNLYREALLYGPCHIGRFKEREIIGAKGRVVFVKVETGQIFAVRRTDPGYRWGHYIAG